MALDVRHETGAAGVALPLLAGAFEGDPFQTGALTFSLDALVGDPPAGHACHLSNFRCLAHLPCILEGALGYHQERWISPSGHETSMLLVNHWIGHQHEVKGYERMACEQDALGDMFSLLRELRLGPVAAQR